MSKPDFTFDVYFAESDGVPVVHVETPGEWDELSPDKSIGPRCRIYLNDEPIYENPAYQGEGDDKPQPEEPMTLTNIVNGPPINAYNEADAIRKEAYHKKGRTALRALARALNLERGQYDLRSNKAGIAVPGEITLHTDKLYVQILQSCTGLAGVLFRTCKGRKDYSGGMNHFANITELENPARFAEKLTPLLDESY